MKPDSSHIKQIKVVSNTHWDREFRRSFEKTRRRLLTMLDTTLDILDADPNYHSFTLDGHSLLLDDYLEMRPERRAQVEALVRSGRLIAGPYYTLAEEFSIGQEPLVRNLLWGRKTVEKYGGKPGTVAYTPSSWGQTGQLPQILAEFGLRRMMFYRGVSHHECDAEFRWRAPDGTEVLASRFAIYARYNWYYQVHRAVTVGRTFAKDYQWGEQGDVPVRFSDGLAGSDLAFDLKAPSLRYDRGRLRQAIIDMVETEGRHFTTEVFLAMHGHDISVAHPLESQIIADARELLRDEYRIEQTSLEAYWDELEKHLDASLLPVLEGERRAYLKEGKWTFLFPGTISARTYLKQADFEATTQLVRCAEPLATLAASLGASYPKDYVDRGWKYLLSNHTHDANGGCAPDAVCADMQYRYRKVSDIAEIVTEDAIAHVVRNLSGRDLPADVMQLVVFNPLPVARDSVLLVDLEISRRFKARSVTLEAAGAEPVECQAISSERSSSFVDSIWDVPTILESDRLRFYARFPDLPPLGYRSYLIRPEAVEIRHASSLVTAPDTMENEHLRVKVNANGTCDVVCKQTGRLYQGLNYLSDQGETGNAWRHAAPRYERLYTSLGARAALSVTESGPLVSAITAEFDFAVPIDYADGFGRNSILVSLPVKVAYRLEKNLPGVGINLTLDNRARDHWLRANFPTDFRTDVSWADTHFDLVSRPIPLPDSTGWVEPAGGTHPLQTFFALTDGNSVLAVLPRGLFEYEVLDDKRRTGVLTLLRCCRIKLAVSEEKQTELPDHGVQCPGLQHFEYFLHFGKGNAQTPDLFGLAAGRSTPPRAVMSGRGLGSLPPEASLFEVRPAAVHVSCVKRAEDGRGFVIRCFNPTPETQIAAFAFSREICEARMCRMDETEVEDLQTDKSSLVIPIGVKKIRTLKVILRDS